MKFLPLSAVLLTSMSGLVSGQTWNIRFWASTDCSPNNVPIQQRQGTGSMSCRQLSIVNGFSKSFKFNGANAFNAQVCHNTDCTDCIEVECDSDGNACINGNGEVFRSFLVTRDENCPGLKVLG